MTGGPDGHCRNEAANCRPMPVGTAAPIPVLVTADCRSPRSPRGPPTSARPGTPTTGRRRTSTTSCGAPSSCSRISRTTSRTAPRRRKTRTAHAGTGGSAARGLPVRSGRGPAVHALRPARPQPGAFLLVLLRAVVPQCRAGRGPRPGDGKLRAHDDRAATRGDAALSLHPRYVRGGAVTIVGDLPRAGTVDERARDP